MKIKVEIDTNCPLHTIKDLVARYSIKKIQLTLSTVTGLRVTDCVDFLEKEKIAVELKL